MAPKEVLHVAIKNSKKTKNVTHLFDEDDTDGGVRKKGRVRLGEVVQDTHTAVKDFSNPVGPHVKVSAKPDETVESLLRRFNREVQKTGLLQRLRELEFYEKPSIKKKKEKSLREKRIKDYERWAE